MNKCVVPLPIRTDAGKNEKVYSLDELRNKRPSFGSLYWSFMEGGLAVFLKSLGDDDDAKYRLKELEKIQPRAPIGEVAKRLQNILNLEISDAQVTQVQSEFDAMCKTEQAIKTFEPQKRDLERQHKQLENDVESLKKRIGKEKGETTTLQNEANELESKVKDIRKQIDKKKEEQGSAELELVRVEQVREGVMGRLAAEKKDLEAIRLELSYLTKAIQEKKSERDKAKEILEQCKKARQKADEDRQTQILARTDAEKARDVARKDEENAKKERDSLIKSRDELRIEITKLEKDINSVKSKKSRCEIEKNELDQQCSELERKLTDVRTQKEEILKRWRELWSSIRDTAEVSEGSEDVHKMLTNAQESVRKMLSHGDKWRELTEQLGVSCQKFNEALVDNRNTLDLTTRSYRDVKREYKWLAIAVYSGVGMGLLAFVIELFK